MLAILKNRAYRHLFPAQVIALIGTGMATVALGMLAFELAGADAGAVLGTALAIKMEDLVPQGFLIIPRNDGAINPLNQTPSKPGSRREKSRNLRHDHDVARCRIPRLSLDQVQ